MPTSSETLENVTNANYNYGTTPNVPVAEQNQTYFAYWNSIGGTGPEYMRGTGYYIKYLIDINGNVVNPEPYTETTSIDAVALHNLKANFEVGKRAIVKTIEPDPTQPSPPDANVLNGTHTIAHIGKIVPVLVTETGDNDQEYITTMSFGSPITQTDSYIPNLLGRFNVSGPNVIIGTGIFNQYIPFNQNDLADSIPSWTLTNSTNGSWRIESSSIQSGTRIRFKIDLNMAVIVPPNLSGTLPYIEILVLRNGAYFNIWGDEGVTKTLYDPNNNNFTGIPITTFGQFTSGYSEYFDYNEDDVFEVTVRTNRSDSGYAPTILGNGTSWFRVYQEINPSSGGGLSTLIPGVNIATSNYFISASNYPQPNQRGYSVLTFSPELTSIWNSDFIQNLDPLSSAFNFSPITIPFNDLKPGDFIRFEYRKNQTYTIFNITPTSSLNNENVLQLSIMPSLSNISGPIDIDTFNIELNHFQIYRVLNDGLYITLDVTKNIPTNTYTGLLIPEFISEELSTKLETLIQDLTQKEIIQ